MLDEQLRAHQRAAAARDAIASLRGTIDARREELRSEALALGGRLFAEKPRAVAHRLAGWWESAPARAVAR